MTRLTLLAASLAALPLAACASDDAPRPEPLACDDVQTRTFRVTGVEPVLRAADADAAGADLDGDGGVDNGTGNLMSALVQGAYPDRDMTGAWTTQLDARFADGLTWLVQVQTCGAGDADGEARVAVTRGVLLDDGRVRVGGDAIQWAGGVRRGAWITADAGYGRAPLTALADFTGLPDAGWHPLENLTVAVTLDGDRLAGSIAGGLTPGYAEPIARGFLPFLNGLMTAGETEFGEMIDRDGDGQVSVEELIRTDVFEALTYPDLDLLDDDGRFAPGLDGERDSLSFGFEVEAVEVEVED